MTEAQIISVLGAGNMDTRTFIDDVVFISFGKDKNIMYEEIHRVRFLFDTTNDMLEVSFCRPFSQNAEEPAHGKFDIIDWKGVSTVFEYLVDSAGDLIADYYPFSSISLISLRRGVYQYD